MAARVTILFHHSNVRLQLSFERALAWLFVTPRLHGIHHSRIPDQMNSNWSSGLSVWDRLHGTFRDDVPQERISVGVSGFDNVEDVGLGRLLTTPFSRRGRVRV
jgi:sterol desaturase/sphingolipid hydroxylase (fatty acid hydroxylase superfamily)